MKKKNLPKLKNKENPRRDEKGKKSVSKLSHSKQSQQKTLQDDVGF